MIREEIQYLFDRGMFGMKMGLDNIRALLSHHRIDHSELRSVHIAGTNGKGSVANIIAQVLTANGYKTGLFTSPHIEKFNERIKIDGAEINDEELSGYIRFFKEGIEKFNCTFFEANTAIALKYFTDKKVDVAVIETGLGGRLDSTNVITPVLSVITGIDLDHQKQLGDSIIQIAREKSGIIKPRIPAVLNTRKRSVLRLIRSVCAKKRSPLYHAVKNDPVFTQINNRLYIDTHISGVKIKSALNLKGSFQKDNLRTSVAALKILSKQFPLDPVKVKTSLENISIKGRMEVISEEPFIMLDAAHNAQGLNSLKKDIGRMKNEKIHLIIGTVKDKDHERTLNIIAGMDAVKYFTGAANKRMLEPEAAKNHKMLKYDKNTYYFKDPVTALEKAIENYRNGDAIIVSGSHFVLGDLLNGSDKLK